MQLWTLWLDTLRHSLDFLSTNVGLGLGLGIVALTLALRSALLPIAWPNAYRACIRQKKMTQLQSELQRLKERYADQPQMLAEQTLALYRKHGVSPFDARALAGGVAQLPVFLGMFQVLRDGVGSARFLWAPNLSRPDVWFALLAGLATMIMMSVNPDLPESLRNLMIAVPTLLAVVAAVKFSSALAVYWTASNCFSAVQTLILHRVVARRTRSGTLGQ